MGRAYEVRCYDSNAPMTTTRLTFPQRESLSSYSFASYFCHWWLRNDLFSFRFRVCSYELLAASRNG